MVRSTPTTTTIAAVTPVPSLPLGLLDQLAQKYGTDKSEHDYCRLYERHLPVDPKVVVEVGVAQGASLKMWADYYPQATILGADQDISEVADPPENVILLQHEQTDRRLGNHLLTQHHYPVDVVIDDASHLSSKTIATFEMLWALLRKGGLYVIEDTSCGYNMEFQRADGFSEPTILEFLQALADECNYTKTFLAGRPAPKRLGFNVGAVHFYPDICFVEKLQ